MTENLQIIETEKQEICDLSQETGICVSLARVLRDNLDKDTKIGDLWALAEVLKKRLKDIQHRLNDLLV